MNAQREVMPLILILKINLFDILNRIDRNNEYDSKLLEVL